MTDDRITLEAARVNAGLIQAAAAEEIGVSVATLRNWETGKSAPTWDKVNIIERVYNRSASKIFFGKKLAISEIDAEPPAES